LLIGKEVPGHSKKTVRVGREREETIKNSLTGVAHPSSTFFKSFRTSVQIARTEVSHHFALESLIIPDFGDYLKG
jgi:hypothetical protein